MKVLQYSSDIKKILASALGD